MAKKPTLSPTKITTFLACPTKYMWTYVDARGKQFVRAKSYFSFGTSLHSVLQDFHKAEDMKAFPIQSALEESWIDAGYGSAEEMADAFGEGREILEKYVERELSSPTHAKTLFVEKQFKTDLGEFILLGRLDRVDEHEDGTIEVVDYKSGRDGVEDQHVKDDIAMSIYQLLLRKHFDGKPVRARIIALRANSSGVASLDETEIAEFEFEIVELGSRILGMNWEEHRPSRKALCDGCDFVRLCSKSEGFSN